MIARDPSRVAGSVRYAIFSRILVLPFPLPRDMSLSEKLRKVNIDGFVIQRRNAFVRKIPASHFANISTQMFSDICIYVYRRAFTANKNNLKIPVDMILLGVYYVYNIQLRYFISSDALKYLPSRRYLSFSPHKRIKLHKLHNCGQKRNSKGDNINACICI